jgi:hypothetical protein
MTIKLTLREKLYLVALGGDVPESRRLELFSMSRLPVQAGPAVMAEGKNFVGRIAGVARPTKKQRRRGKSQLR